MTTWADYASAVQEILPFLSRRLRIFDEDLVHPGLENPDLAAKLGRFLGANRFTSCDIVLRNPLAARDRSPRLMALLGTYSDRLRIFECAPRLLSLHDNFILVDDAHALIRIHKDHARSRFILDDRRECTPYIERFDDLLEECETRIYPTTLGL
ncbi:MAG: hypothetical protein LBD67_02515 [Candidatus Accumulibacter sp.]|nr:hypothetical protein [Accumulibacter sp.]